MHLTMKQQELIRVIAAGNEDGTPADLDQILERLNYKTTKDSLHFSLRALINRNMIEKKGTADRRGRRRTLVAMTAHGKQFFRPHRSHVPDVSIHELDEFTPEGVHFFEGLSVSE